VIIVHIRLPPAEIRRPSQRAAPERRHGGSALRRDLERTDKAYLEVVDNVAGEIVSC
jgi:hypothetical protein